MTVGIFDPAIFDPAIFDTPVAVGVSGGGIPAGRFRRALVPREQWRTLKEVRSQGTTIVLALVFRNGQPAVEHGAFTVVSAGTDIGATVLMRVGSTEVIHIDEEEELLALGLLPGEIE